MNITTAREEHARYCHQPEGGWLGDMKPADGEYGIERWGKPGDVRRCVHGRLMVGVEVLGVVPCYWSDLSPVFTPILWRRARRAEAAKDTVERS